MCLWHLRFSHPVNHEIISKHILPRKHTFRLVAENARPINLSCELLGCNFFVFFMPNCLVTTFSDGKKGAHTATPHPAKKSEKKTAETPKSSAQVSCKSCSKLVSPQPYLPSVCYFCDFCTDDTNFTNYFAGHLTQKRVWSLIQRLSMVANDLWSLFSSWSNGLFDGLLCIIASWSNSSSVRTWSDSILSYILSLSYVSKF